MSLEILINATREETRVAVLEGNQVQQLLTERAKDRGIVGNIYKGKVVRVLPGMQAAFVDIGLEKSAFLYVGDVLDPEKRYEDLVGESSEEEGDRPASGAELARNLDELHHDPTGRVFRASSLSV